MFKGGQRYKGPLGVNIARLRELGVRHGKEVRGANSNGGGC